MIKIKKIKKVDLKSESGMALLMVIGSIALLSYLLVDFTFETKINRLKSYNAQDRAQARLNAEAGIHFSLAKLRIYQEVRNKLETNESLKSTIKPSQVESILVQPFVFPIPLPPKSSLIQKNALSEFKESTVLQGNLNVTMSQITGFLNPNNLRIPVPEPTNNQNGNDPNDPNDPRDNGNLSNNSNDPNDPNNQNNQKSPLQITEEKILQMLTEELRLKREEDNLFDQLYPTLRAEMLLKELKYYVNNPQALQDPEIPEIENIYTDAGLIAKHAPMASIDEFYQLAGWPEVVVNMVKDRFTVHEVGFISLNDLNENTLRLLFPNITPEQSEEFFRYRDGDPELGEEPKPFQAVEDFKNLVVNQLAILDATRFDERQKEFEAANLRFGVAGKLYRVKSTGMYKTATVSLTAYIDLPVKPQPPAPPTNPNGQNPNNGLNPNGNPNDPDDPNNQNNPNDPNNTGGTPAGQNPNGNQPAFKLELMPPRIVEIRVD